MSKEWLNNLKEGDTVYCDHGVSGYLKLTVKRFTKTMIVCEHSNGTEFRFYRNDGRAVGSSGYFIEYLREPSPIIEKYFLAQSCTARFDTKELRKKVSEEALENLRAAIVSVKQEIRKWDEENQ